MFPGSSTRTCSTTPKTSPQVTGNEADLLRLELIFLHGGSYVDTDVVPLKPFDNLRNRQVLVALSPQQNHLGHHPITQAVIGSVPGHLWVGECITRLPEAVEKFGNKPLAQMTGPWHLTRVWKDTPYDVEPLPSSYLYPQKREPGAYCYHMWNNALRKQGKGVA